MSSKMSVVLLPLFSWEYAFTPKKLDANKKVAAQRVIIIIIISLVSGELANSFIWIETCTFNYEPKAGWSSLVKYVLKNIGAS